MVHVLVREQPLWNTLLPDMQGYVAHGNQLPPRTRLLAYVWGLILVLGEGGLSSERDTPADAGVCFDSLRGEWVVFDPVDVRGTCVLT